MAPFIQCQEIIHQRRDDERRNGYRNIFDTIYDQVMLYAFATQQCKDPRDKFYGLQGLFSADSSQRPIDYNKSITEVFVDALRIVSSPGVLGRHFLHKFSELYIIIGKTPDIPMWQLLAREFEMNTAQIEELDSTLKSHPSKPLNCDEGPGDHMPGCNFTKHVYSDSFYDDLLDRLHKLDTPRVPKFPETPKSRSERTRKRFHLLYMVVKTSKSRHQWRRCRSERSSRHDILRRTLIPSEGRHIVIVRFRWGKVTRFRVYNSSIVSCKGSILC